MPGIFQDYRVALLDASFFVSKFPAYVQQGLTDVNIYVADTFNAEIEQYKAILPPERATNYTSNISFLNQNKQLKTLNLDSFGSKSAGLHNDTWGLLTILVSMNAKFVFITANQILIQRVVLHSLKVDIYDLNAGKFIRYEDFPSYKNKFEISNNAVWMASEGADDHVSERSTLYCSSGGTITLGNEIKSGLEANLYLVSGNSGIIAKVFKKAKLSAAKFRNIKKLQGINATLNIPWALFPTDLLYYDAGLKRPAGFIEKYTQCGNDLDETPLYLGDINLSDQYLNTRISASIELCQKVVRQVRYLNTYGFLISDFNLGNFAINDSDHSYIQMWDTDSFGYGTFFSGYCAGNRTRRVYDTSKKAEAIDFCSEALYLFVFSVLSLGDSPISEFTGKFKFDNPQYPAMYRKRLFPNNLWKLFEEVFRGEKTPSVEVLLYELQRAHENCKRSYSEDKTYKELLSDVIAAAQPTPPPTPTPIPTPTSTTPTPASGDSGMPKWLKWILIAAVVGFVIYCYNLT